MSRCTKIEMPTAIVLLGATGDLAQKKLLPSLMHLYAKGVLPERFHVVAFSKDEMTTDEYRAFARNIIDVKDHGHDPALVASFLDTIQYVQGLFDDHTAFEQIKQILLTYDEQIGRCTSKLFYLAVPPVFYDNIFEQIAHTKLDQSCAIGDGWTRILVEKPFGSDLENAHKLEDKLSVLFREEQIYRIDHYLAKDALQNILAFRFSNVLFENNWNKDYVEAIYIKVFEKFDVSTRGAFFDGVGALRDVGQNHMLQMLALIAMDNPKKLDANHLREKRAEILHKLKTPQATELGTTVIKGQYEGYRQTKNVDPASKTETYFALKTYIENDRWKGVPFYLEHGKAVDENKTEISVRFRSSKYCVCGASEPHNHPNMVRFSISPEQKITVRFWVRKPGLKYELEPNDLVFDRESKPRKTDMTITDAYEEVLFDAICGDQTLFVSNSEQTAAWTFVTTILNQWKDIEPLPYAPGTDGPESDIKNEIHDTIQLFT